MDRNAINHRERIMRRRIRKIKFFLRRILPAVVLILVLILAVAGIRKVINVSKIRSAEENSNVISNETDTDETKITHDVPELEEYVFPFNQMSADWGADDLVGWWHYDIPEKYQKAGGYFPDLVQVYTYCLCKEYNIRYAVAVAVIEAGSGFQYDAESKDGNKGYMQISYKWHSDKMDS